MKQSFIIILLLLSACSPKNANFPATSQQDTKPYTYRENIAKLKKQFLTEVYSTSSKGEINLNAEKGNAYFKWDEQGMTIFWSRDFVPSPSQKGAEELNKFLTEFRQSVYSNSEGKMYIPGTDVYFQFDDKGITLFVPKTEGIENYYERGDAYYKKGQYDEAVSDFTKALEINPKFAEAHYYRGIAYDKMGLYDEAISDYNKALEINPKYALAYYARGFVYNQYKGQHDQAISDYSKALEINPRFVWAYVSRGICYSKKGQYDEGISDFSKALEINPRDILAYRNRGAAYHDKGQDDEAIFDYNKALEINPNDAVAYRERGDSYYSKGEYDSAISDFNKAIDINPKDAVAYLYRGDAYEKKDRYKEAIVDYNKAIEIDPKYIMAYNNLSWILSTAKESRIRNGKKARELAMKACELSNSKSSFILDTLAAAYAREGDFENAVKWQEKATEFAEPAKRADYGERLESYKQRRPWPSD